MMTRWHEPAGQSLPLEPFDDDIDDDFDRLVPNPEIPGNPPGKPIGPGRTTEPDQDTDSIST